MDTYHFNEKRIIQRDIDELIGVCRGILADDLVNKDEAYFVLSWIEEKFLKENIQKNFLVNYIYEATYEILEKKDFSSESLNKYKNKLKKIMSLDVILDKDVSIKNNTICCCSGIFAKDKSIIKQKLKEKNITIKNRLTLDVNYLIIGSYGNPEWKHGAYGNKIEDAIKYRKRPDTDMLIISEQELLKNL